MVAKQTSLSHPLTIDAVAVPSGGRIGMTFCPGKKYPEPWDRDLDVDLECIRDWGTAVVVTFMEDHELSRCEVAGIGSAVLARGMRWFHLPIVGASIPDNVFEARWANVGPVLRSCLVPSGAIVLHCRGGLGRTGTIAGRLLVELGVPPQCAVAQIRLARPGTIETIEQEAYVLGMRPVKALEDEGLHEVLRPASGCGRGSGGRPGI
jgi:protein-tyrosine phosphatase